MHVVGAHWNEHAEIGVAIAAPTMRATSTRASSKHAPPECRSSVAGARALAVSPFRVLWRQSPLGRLTTPRAMLAVTCAMQCTSPSVLKARTGSPSAMPRGSASAGWICRRATLRRSWPNVELMVFSLAGENQGERVGQRRRVGLVAVKQA